jgi:hypothetical protein
MDQKQFEASLHDVEIRLRRLKTLYDQWLAGFERTEPVVPRAELDELIQRLKREQVRNTALRFRLQQVGQRYMMLITYWRRIGRQMEEGTYQRDVLKARKLRDRAKAEADARESSRPEGAYDVDVDVDLDGALAEAAEAAAAISQAPAPPANASDELKLNVPAAAAVSPGAPPIPGQKPVMSRPPPLPPVPPPRPAVAARTISPFAMPMPPGTSVGPRPPPVPPNTSLKPAPPPTSAANTAARAGAAGLSNDDVQRIYSKYLAARKDNSERVDNVRLENIEKSLRGMLPQLEKKHAGKKIDFEVVVKDGKVALKPVAK